MINDATTAEELEATYKGLRAVAIDGFNAATRAMEYVDRLGPAVRKLALSEYIPLQPGGSISASLEYKRLRVPCFLEQPLTQIKGMCVARACGVGFEIVHPQTDNVLCTLDMTKPLFEISVEMLANQLSKLPQAQQQQPPTKEKEKPKKSKQLF